MSRNNKQASDMRSVSSSNSVLSIATGNDDEISQLCAIHSIDRGTFLAVERLVLNRLTNHDHLEKKRKIKESGLDGWVVPKISQQQVHELHEKLLLLIADAALAFRFVERESFREIIALLRLPALDSVPTRKQLAGPILIKHFKKAQREQWDALAALKSRNAFATLLLDGWKSVDNKHLLGSSVAVVNRLAILETTQEGSEHDGLAVARDMELLIIKAHLREEIRLGAVTTDDAPQCARARRIMALRFSELIFLPCWAHQIVCFDESN